MIFGNLKKKETKLVTNKRKNVKIVHARFEPVTSYLRALFLTNCAILFIRNNNPIENI